MYKISKKATKATGGRYTVILTPSSNYLSKFKYRENKKRAKRFKVNTNDTRITPSSIKMIVIFILLLF